MTKKKKIVYSVLLGILLFLAIYSIIYYTDIFVSSIKYYRELKRGNYYFVNSNESLQFTLKVVFRNMFFLIYNYAIAALIILQLFICIKE